MEGRDKVEKTNSTFLTDLPNSLYSIDSKHSACYYDLPISNINTFLYPDIVTNPMTNHQKPQVRTKKFAETVMTPELRKELNDPKGWVTGRLLPKRAKAKNKKMEVKGKGKGKGKGKKRYDSVPTEEEPKTEDTSVTEEEDADEDEDVEQEDE